MKISRYGQVNTKLGCLRGDYESEEFKKLVTEEKELWKQIFREVGDVYNGQERSVTTRDRYHKLVTI